MRPVASALVPVDLTVDPAAVPAPAGGAAPGARGIRGAGRAWGWFLGAAALVVASYYLLPDGLPRDAAYVAVGLAAVVAIECGVRANRPSQAWPWHLLATGTMVWSVGDALGSWFSDVLGADGFPTVADPVYLAGYPVMAVGLLLFIRGRRSVRDTAGLLDSAILAVALGVLAWVLLARPTLDLFRDSAAAAAVAAAYPVADIVLVGLLIRLVTTPGGRSRSFRFLVAAMALLAVGDALTTGLRLTTWDASGAIDFLWLLSYALTGVAALHPSMVSMTEASRVEPVRFSRLRLASLAGAAVVAPVVLAVQAALGLRLDLWAVVVGSVALSGLVVARMKLSLDLISTANAEREAARVALAHQAAHDSLTGLPNRAQAVFLMRGALSRAQRSGAVVGVLFVDLDGFKQVNDTLGHAAGDEVLVVAGARMQEAVRDGDVVARFGGDEFVVLVEPVDEEASAVAVAERLVRVLSEPVVLGSGREVSIGASVGVAVALDGTVDPERLLAEADVAVYRAKLAGRGRVEVFDTSLRQELDRRQGLQDALLAAIAAGDLELRHEPVVDLRAGRVAGYEAKVSWPRPGADELTRDAILPVAERTELVCELDAWALRTAARQAASIPAGSRPALVEVPVSVRHLRRRRVVTDVAAALAAAELDPARLVLVVGASDVVADVTALAHLGELRSLGVMVCVEGFGTHEAPTDRWALLPVDLVRLDAEALARGPMRSSMLLRLTVETAHTFGWQVVAAGVTTADQLAALTEMGCRYAQGPMPRRTLAALAATTDRGSAAPTTVV
ncbi:putative bifunctional diguanylate cyclase/phosphodiesterase [Microlunatus flavus]|uniref:Diguanylate cyclase (GGDEF) domain-containing protein n=1 Tax=Microlunatus flavus TaxID=1036181 RepID=A0A1H9AQ84_9ACTN|nr:diguanylate cyclase [Microlunatus flavus]SEP78078.1 diguanylate cyclase (GGDEF) domain-containing protein [Microlunatus flavus]